MATPAALGVILTLILSSNYVELCDLYNLQSMGFVYFIIHASRAWVLKDMRTERNDDRIF